MKSSVFADKGKPPDANGKTAEERPPPHPPRPAPSADSTPEKDDGLS